MADNDEIFEGTLEQQLNTLRIDAKQRRKVLRQLKRLEKQIVSLILDIAPADSEKFQTRRLRELLKSVRGQINIDYKTIDSFMREDLVELGSIEVARHAKVLESGLDVQLTTASLTAVKLNTIYSTALIDGAPSAAWWRRQSRSLQRNFEDEMRTGLLLGETNDQLVRRVRGTRAFNFTNGVMHTSRVNADALVRSSVQAVSNTARFSIMEANDDLIGSYRHVSTLDSRTSERCIVRDSLRWKSETLEPIGHSVPFQVPPIHWNCRSTIVAEVKGTNLPDDAERASVDGPVPANTSFRNFLDKKGRVFQDEVLGPGKAELFREGKITINQLLDQSGNPLTLEELRRKYDN